MGLTVAGAYRIIDFVLKIPGNLKTISMGELAAGLALLVVGAPVWGLSWQILQLSLTEDEERRSTLRLVIFYLVTFTGAGITLVSGEIFMSHILRWLFGEPLSLALFLEREAPAFALLVPFGIIWSSTPGI